MNIIISIITILGAGASLVIYAHASFPDKDEVASKDKVQALEKYVDKAVIERLDRIEKKLDRAIGSK